MSTNDVTINDVARAAGVSKGTVDRVIHNRGEVSAKSKEKVLKAIEELGFRPNVYASLLASQKKHMIACLIPEYQKGDFWSLTAKGLEEASSMVARYGVTVKEVCYNQYDLKSFQDACADVMGMSPSAVVLAPLFRDETLRFVNLLKDKGIPYVYIDSKLEEDGYMAYFGMPMYQSGRLCAFMLTENRLPSKVCVVRVSRDKEGLSDPTVKRRAGFLDFMAEHYPQVSIQHVVIDPKIPGNVESSLESAFGPGPVTDCGIVMFNSRVHVIADYLRAKGMESCRVVGFDALEGNISALKNGTVQVLIAQHSDSQAAAAVNALVEFLVMGATPEFKDFFTQLDILNVCNCDYYL